MFVPNCAQILKLIRSRRSKRLFKEKTVEKVIIEKVVDAARFAPCGHNEQSTGFIVVQAPKTIHAIATLTTGYLGKLVQQIRNPISRMFLQFVLGKRSTASGANLAPEMEHLVNLFNSGTDWILRKPPVLLLFHADSAGGTFAGVNATWRFRIPPWQRRLSALAVFMLPSP